MIVLSDLPDHTARGYFVYALTEPDTGEFRYVGMTDNPKLRYMAHCQWRSIKKNLRLREWVQSLDERGEKPGFSILVKLTGPHARRSAYLCERQMIRDQSSQRPLSLLQKQCVAIPRHTLIEHDGKRMGVAAWAKRLGISRQALHQRLKSHPPSIALATPRGQPCKAAAEQTN